MTRIGGQSLISFSTRIAPTGGTATVGGFDIAKNSLAVRKALAWKALVDLAWLHSKMGDEENAASVMSERWLKA